MAAIVAAGPERRALHVERRRARASRGANTGHHVHPPQAARRARARRRRRSSGAAPEAGAGPGHPVFLQNPPPIRIGGTLDQEPVPVHAAGHRHRRALPAARTMLEAKMRELPGLQDVTSDLQLKNPQVDGGHRPRPGRRARAVGASRSRTRSTRAFGSRQVSTIYAPNNEYQVILELRAAVPARPEALSLLYVRSHDRQAGAAAAPWPTLTRDVGPLTVNHSGQLPAVTISFNLAGRLARRRGRARSTRLARQDRCRPTITTSFQGTAQAFQSSLKGLGLLLLLAIAGDLHGARHPLRELHPPAHDPLGAAVRRLRRAGHADDLPRRAVRSTPSSA